VVGRPHERRRQPCDRRSAPLIAAPLVAAAALVAPVHTATPTLWTVAQARRVLAQDNFVVTDTKQADRPEYDLVFSARQARSLRPAGTPSRGRWRTFTFDGTGHNGYTDADVRVRFHLSARGLSRFRGPAADLSQPALPIRAAFYYAWYPEAWTRDAIYPYSVFHPSLGYYDADQAAIVRRETDALRYAHLDAGIYSWWGIHGSPPTDERFWRYLAAARTTRFRWAIYYEPEGYGDPSVEQIRSELAYIRDTYAAKPAYLKVNGRFVVFVYGGAESCATPARWKAANATVGAYLVLKAFDDYLTCPAQPDAWHQYSGTRSEYTLPPGDPRPGSFMVSPGFDEVRDGHAALTRDAPQWRRSLADMVASQAPWQLVISFNEWPEGTSVESAREWASQSGYGTYLDALHDELP